MSDATDFEAAALDITKTAATAATAAEAATAATAAAAGSTVIPIVGEVVIALTALLYALGFFDQTDKIDSAVEELTVHFDAILSAEDKVILMKDVASQLSIAQAQLGVMREVTPGRSLTDAQRSTLDTNTSQVVLTLGKIAYWLRPFFGEAVFDDGWSGYLTPDPSLGPGSTVFDYRLTMPAYLEAIVIRMVAMLALDGQFTPASQRELAGIASILEGYHDKIANAIVKLPTPSILHLRRNGGDPSPWDVWLRPYGAVETYSTYSAISNWPGESWVPDKYPNVDDPSNLVLFYKRHALGTLARWKKVYSDVGLHGIWSIVRHLKLIAQVPLTTNFDSGSDWSLREVGDLLVEPAPWEPPPVYSATDLVGRVGKPLSAGFRDAFTNW